jgi:heme exporter protein A
VTIALQAFNFTGFSAHGVEVWRGDRRVLPGVSVEATAGECVHVLGPNGSGKTTLLRAIAGLLTPEAGRVECNGRDTRADRDAWCAVFTYLAHNDGLKPELSVRENLAFETALRRELGSGDIGAALADLGIADCSERLAATLSAGQRRRAAFARVMLAGAALWILDEPYTHLDRDGSVIVSAIIGRHLSAGGAALIAAHQPPAIPGHRARSVELTA